MWIRRFEFVGGTSSKFWEIEVDDRVTTTRWGKLGATGQSKVTRASTPEAAEKFARDKIEEKIRKAYQEVPVGGSAPARGPGPNIPAPVATDLRRLGGPEPTGGIAAAVIEALEASKPTLETNVHQEVASRFLHGMAFDRGRERVAAMKQPTPVDEGTLTAILGRLLRAPAIIEPEFRVLDAMYLLEAMLGTERVATILVNRCLLIAPEKGLRAHSLHLVRALEAMKGRLSMQWQSIAAPLSAIKASNVQFDVAVAALVKPSR